MMFQNSINALLAGISPMIYQNKPLSMPSRANRTRLVIDIIEHNFIARLMSGDVSVVQGWLDALPVAWQAKFPIIGIAQAGILMITGQFDACARRLDKVEQLTLSGSDHPDLFVAG